MAVVIIPAYKPDQTLVEIADQLWSCGCEMVVVDDGSGSEYQKIFDQISDVCIILHHEENYGKGAAIKTGLTYIKNEMWDSRVIGVMDSDGQHLVEDMRSVLKEAGEHTDSLVLGVREVGRKMPLRSRLGNGITREVFRVISGVRVSDTQTGLRAFGTDLLPMLLETKGERYEYEMNVLLAAAKTHIPIREVPIRTVYHDAQNTCSYFRAVRDSARIYKDILKFTLSSLSSFLLDYVLFALLMLFLPHTALPVLFANIAARLFSAFYNYSMNCRFVFHTDRKLRTAAEYFCLAAVILTLNNVILEWLVQWCGVPVYPAKLMTECILFLVSWLVQRCMIFKKTTGKSYHKVRQDRLNANRKAET